MSSNIGGTGDPLARATEEADRLAAKQTDKAATAATRQEAAQASILSMAPPRNTKEEKKQRKKSKGLKEQASRVKKGQQAGKKEEGKKEAGTIRNKAAEFAKRNPELDEGRLNRLARDHIKDKDSSSDIQKKMEELYDDVSLRDEALEFLEETTDGELLKEVNKARAEFHEESGVEIAAGRNIGTEARRFAEEGLGSPTALRDMYRDLVTNPRDARQLFKQMSGRFSFQELKKVAEFLFHSLGRDMKSRGPSIEPALLHRLTTETRSLQAVLGVYTFFKGRMSLVRSLFAQSGLAMPKNLNFETISKAFMSMVQDRYPSSDKVLRQASSLGIEKWLEAKIHVFSQMRDGVREVAMNQIFLSTQQRDDLYHAILEALEELEDELEELGYDADDEDDELAEEEI